MNPAQRTALVIAAVIAVVGVFLLTQGDDGGSEQTLEPTETAAVEDGTETSEGTGGAEAPPTTTEAETQTQEQPPPPRVETIRIRDNQLASGEPRTLEYESGETVRLRFRSNVASEIHIHGYDEYVDVPAGGSKTARFKADAEGIFEVEDHATGALLAKLEVRP